MDAQQIELRLVYFRNCSSYWDDLFHDSKQLGALVHDLLIKPKIVFSCGGMATKDDHEKVRSLTSAEVDLIALTICKRPDYSDQFSSWQAVLKEATLLVQKPRILWKVEHSLPLSISDDAYCEIWQGPLTYANFLDRVQHFCKQLLGAKSVFLCHNWADKPFVRRLASDLRNRGVRVWIDEAELQVGDSLIERIRAAIDSIDYVAVVLSQNSIKSPWVQREIDIAMNQEIAHRRIKVLPILLDDCDLPGFLLGKVYADFTRLSSYTQGLEKLLRRLGAVQQMSAGNDDVTT